MAAGSEWLDAAEVRGVMDPWLQRESIAEDITAWVFAYRDRAGYRAATPQAAGLIQTTLNGLLDELNAQMFLAESKAKATEVIPCTPEQHCDEDHCCKEEQ